MSFCVSEKNLPPVFLFETVGDGTGEAKFEFTGANTIAAVSLEVVFELTMALALLDLLDILPDPVFTLTFFNKCQSVFTYSVTLKGLLITAILKIQSITRHNDIRKTEYYFKPTQ